MTQPPGLRHDRPPTPDEGLLVRARPGTTTGSPQVPRTWLIAKVWLLPSEPAAPQLPGEEQETTEIPSAADLPTAGTVSALPQPPEAAAGGCPEVKPVSASPPAAAHTTANRGFPPWAMTTPFPSSTRPADGAPL